MAEIDNPAQEASISRQIQSKPSLRRLYSEFYAKYREVISQCPNGGELVELGSGAGFAREVIPDIVTTDVIPYKGIDRIADAMSLSFQNNSISFIGMTNVFHHISNVSRFFKEAERVLMPQGCIFIIDQHKGIISHPVLKYLHHEFYDPDTAHWEFDSSGPLSGSNGALAWIVFQRDYGVFKQTFPNLRVEEYTAHTPLRYWLAGGLRRWNALPRFLYGPVCLLEKILLKLNKNFGSFCYVQIRKQIA